MYIIMYKYSAFRINHKSFRSSMSKNFTVIPGLLPRHPRLRPGLSRLGSLVSRQRTNAICPIIDYSVAGASTITNGCASLVAASVLRT